MRHLVPMPIKQGQDSLCAHISVAVAACVPLLESVNAFGYAGTAGAFDCDIQRALNTLGLKTGHTFQWSARSHMPNFCIASIGNSKWAHSVVIYKGMVIDSNICWPMPLHTYEEIILNMAYVSIQGKRKSKPRWQTIIPILSEPVKLVPLDSLL